MLPFRFVAVMTSEDTVRKFPKQSTSHIKVSRFTTALRRIAQRAVFTFFFAFTMSNPRDKYEVVDTDVSMVVSFEDAADDSPGVLASANAKTDAAGFIVDGLGTFQYFDEFNELVTPPMLPSGQIIDSKNTLQSFASDPLNPSSSLEYSKRSAFTDTLGTNTRVTDETTTRNTDTSLFICRGCGSGTECRIEC
jgi:hypothetical protein